MQRILVACLVVLMSFVATAAPHVDATHQLGQLATKHTGAKHRSARPDKVIQVSAKNPAFTVSLQSNRTTGYQWLLRYCDAKLVVPVSNNYLPPKNKKMMGAPGTSVWKFRVTKAALAVPRLIRIKLVYVRPWQPAPAMHYSIVVVTH